ncbi:HAMP domain-containing sensor histidine kinase [Paenibacillus sp. O199]|uniref:sensor histidine kinase n=1 Tax=Paenibacillus sp. O199 TaxID=1643925 RepID=UPI00137476BF|nr:HAMP domain-containing sensor histidine kinase [Paenibacillus sp. O199]
MFKLFAANLVFYIIFFAIVISGHFFFFERFYQNERASDLQKKLSSFASYYSQQNFPMERISSVMGRFITQNHVQIAILDKQGQIRYDNPFKLWIETDSGERIAVSTSFFSDLSKLAQYGLQKDDRVSIQGEYYDEQNRKLFSPYVITKEYSPSIGTLPNNVNTERLEVVHGSIVSILLPKPGQWNNREGIMAAALKAWFPLPEEYSEQVANGEAFHSEWKEAVSSVQNLVFIQPIIVNGVTQGYLFALTPLTQLEEAFSALEMYYAFFSIVGGLLLIVVLSFLFSKWVSRPLLKLNQTAAQMAKLEFTAISPIKTKDELGSLSTSLVSLSSNLERTLNQLQLTNEKLVEEMEYKSKMEVIQKRFVSDASHELKTPISVVKGYAEGLVDFIAENKREQYARTILREANRMEKLVLDMLELTQLEAQTVKLKPVTFLLYELIAETAANMKPLSNAKTLNILISEDKSLLVVADPEKIEQVVLNYLSNAIHYATEGSSIRLDFELSRSERTVYVSVTNEGPKIPDSELPSIWNRFYREENARSRSSGGTGLGLSIVKEIMQLHQQTFGAENTPSGVKFYFTLPLATQFESS